jgi:uncharacterized protein YqjF (DUF2071 family)
MSSVFLSAQWRKLIMANYAVDPAILQPFLPTHTQLDYFKEKCFVSLVGFMFQDVRIKGLAFPFHKRFEEVNLRFYVQHHTKEGLKRGVVFISEIVPKPAIAMVANTLYGEKYSTLPMRHQWLENDQTLAIGYDWKKSGKWNHLSVEASNQPTAMAPGSEEEFIFEHYYGFTNQRRGQTGVYQVEHPTWQVYPVKKYSIDADFGALYGEGFSGLTGKTPDSVFLAEGSAVKIYKGEKLYRN